MKKLSILIAMVLVVALAVPTLGATFSDVPASHWAYDAVNQLVAAGVVEGYPDGTYKGQRNMTRYEMAMIISRALDNINAERAALEDKVNGLANKEDTLTSAEAQDVTAIVKALMEKNAPEAVEVPKDLTDTQAEQVANLIEALTFEYKAELKTMGADVESILADVDDIEARVAALENKTPAVTFSGKYSVDFSAQDLEGATDKSGVDYYWLEYEIAVADTAFGDGVAPFTTAERDALIAAVKTYFDDANDYAGAGDYVIAGPGGNVTVTVVEEMEDPYVYSDPWDDGSDTVATDVDSEFDQELTFSTSINKGGLKGAIDVDVDNEEDEWEIDSLKLTLENDFVKGTYSDENTISVADYVFNATEFDGVTAEFKDYGLDTFFGIADVAPVDPNEIYTEETVDADHTDDYGYTSTDDDAWEKDVVKFDLDDDDEDLDDDLVPQTEDATTDYYVYGATKAFDLADFAVTAKLVGRRRVADEDMMTNVLGLETSSTLSGMNVDFGLAYSMDKEMDQNDSLLRFGISNDFDVATVDFNYRNVGENFTFLDEDPVLTDDDEDAYDFYTTESNPGVSGYDLTVKPVIMEGLDASVFFASVDDGTDNTKLALDGSYEVLDGLTVSAGYEKLNEVDGTDETKTTSFGAAYALMEGAKATFDYKIADPVENDVSAEVAPVEAAEKEKTMGLGFEYALNDYVAANASYEKVTNWGYLDTLGGHDMEVTTTGFGIDLTDYPVYGDLTASAGFSYENAEGWSYDYDEYDEATDTIVAEDENVKTTGFTAGLGYGIGAADLSYDLGYTKKAGTGVGSPGEGTYTTHKLGLVYGITDATDLTADYEYIKMNAEDNTEDYTVKTATAGVSISF